MHRLRKIAYLVVFLSLFALACVACNKQPAGSGQSAAQPSSAAKPAGGSVPAATDPTPALDLTGTLNIAGGTAHIPVMEEAQKIFAEKYPELKIAIAGGGSGVGIEQVGEGLVDIGNSGRTPKPEEIEKYGLVTYKWAVDGVAVVVNPANTVGELTKEQLIKIFAGEISNWQELGGIDKAINIYTRDEASGTREVFAKEALNEGTVAATANVVVSNGAMKTAVAQDPYGIGYVSVGHLDESVKAVTLDGVTPTVETVTSGEYPVSRGLFSLTKGEATGAAKAFIDFLYTPEGQQIISDKGFIPVAK